MLSSWNQVHLRKILLRPFILFHLNYLIPLLGKLITGEADAYRYLPESTQAFQSPDQLMQLMRKVGFSELSYKMFMFGTVAVHVGRKPIK